MTTDKKPTAEELANNIRESLKVIEGTNENPSAETVSTAPETTEVKTEEVTTTPNEEVVTPKEEAKTEEPVEPVKTEPDYKERFVESTREAQILHAKNKKFNDAIEQANKLPDPTDEELTQEFPEWELMSDVEKKLAKQNLKNERRFKFLDEVTKESKDIDAWNNKVDTFVSDPKTFIQYPDLEGKADEFKIYATKATKRGVDTETLVSAFLFDVEKTKPKHTGSMFPTGAGGSNEKPKVSDKLSMEEGKNLRDTNYNEYVRQLKAGRIQMDPL